MIDSNGGNKFKPDASSAVIGGIASAQDLLKTLVNENSSFDEVLSPQAI